MTFDYADFSSAFPWFFPVMAGIFGAIVGSFLNVVIYRMPLDKSVVTPGSHCACGAPIKWYDNIPVLSWFILRGKARCCGRSYSFRYAFVELLTAALFTTSWLMFPPAKALCGMLFVACMLCALFIDLDHMIIPDTFTIGLGVAGVVLSVFVPSLHGQHDGVFFVSALQSGLISLQGLLIGSGLVLWIALIAEVLLRKEAMGFGDVKFVGAIGAFTGWQGAVFSIFGGAVVGIIWIALAFIWKKIFGDRIQVAPRAETPDGQPAELGMGVQIPFGPMLAVAGLLHFFYFTHWMDNYFAELAAIFQG
ncbi:prepilin peptidase [Rariglobus hedericola]|uniref:Prepilin peptidase n=1 Tax=Rariglobus hedericola TaxID=2597822 RepID=A0A556QGI9_9BACT|nr:A24 family peptidase [Rariglobus hedericola]TSJ75762.1 prepilin peptidase [Rariglobus hedericola]